MPLDAICLSGILGELDGSITGLKIEKVQQPARDQIILSLRGGKKLLLCAGASQARIHLTALSRENPASPPMFCMLLRKHLTGGRIASIQQPTLERVVRLTVDMVDELGEPGQRHLILECMGRRSNLILLDGQERIIDCLRRVDMEMSEARQVLPGLFYHLPPAQEKADPLAIDGAAFDALLRNGEGKPADQFLLDSFFGLSPLICREIAFQALGDSARLLTAGAEAPLSSAFYSWQESVREKCFTPTLLFQGNKPADFSYLPIAQYGESMACESRESFSELLDSFYETREQLERVRQRGHDLIRTATTARDRCGGSWRCRRRSMPRPRTGTSCACAGN